MYDDLASFLRHHQETLGLSAEQIAQQLAAKNAPTHANAVRRWLIGQTKPAAERFDTLLEVLQVVKTAEVKAAYALRWPEAAHVLCDGQVPTANKPPDARGAE